jgi:hypothetical protein
MDSHRALRIAFAVPTVAVLTAAQIALHTSVSVAVIAYNIFWRRHHRLPPKATYLKV